MPDHHPRQPALVRSLYLFDPSLPAHAARSGVDGFDLGESLKVGVVEGEDFTDAVLDHERDQTGVVGLLALDSVLGDRPFPGGIDLGGLGKNLKESAGGGDLGAGLLGAVAKTVGAGWTGSNDVHLVETLRRDGKMLLVAQRSAVAEHQAPVGDAGGRSGRCAGECWCQRGSSTVPE